MTNAIFPIAAVLGLGLTAGIVVLVRRDHLYIRDGLFWLAVAAFSLLFGLWPGLIDHVGGLVGVSYPPALLFLIAIVVLVLRSLLIDLALTGLRREVRRLNQRLALMQAEAEEGKDDRGGDRMQ